MSPGHRYDPETVDADEDDEVDSPAMDGHGRWTDGWHRVALASTMLIYPVITAIFIGQNSNDRARVVSGFVVVLAFCLCYALAAYAAHANSWRRFWSLFGTMTALFLIAVPIAEVGAFFLCAVLVAVATFFLERRATPIVAVAVAAALIVPVAVRPWHSGPGWLEAIIIANTALIVNAFSETVRANQQLIEARAEVARLASVAERTRIARDLHDLLGHSLTAVVIRSEVARRIAATENSAAADAIDEVGTLSRQALSEVRAVVSGYREVSLAMELARGEELLRASGIAADLPTATDLVDPVYQELFGWVLREGLTNVVRHAHAGWCTVLLSSNAVEIRNDGAGPPRSTPGNGLAMLRERVRLAGGTVDAGPVPGGGWRLRVEVEAAEVAS